jgi:hypothetical protein
VTVSMIALRRRLQEAGFRGCKPARKPRLTCAHKKARLEWARQFQTWTIEDCERVCFSDESHFEILGSNAQHVYRRPGERFEEACVVGEVKFPDKVMIWGLISIRGIGGLHFVNGMMELGQYSEVIETKMLPQVREWFPDGNYVFMHDKVPSHRAKYVSKVLKSNDVEVLPWPGNSPDLNPIENVWNYVKRRVRAG